MYDGLVIGELVEAHAVGPEVAHRHTERVDPGEGVELGDRDAGEGVEADGVAKRDEVEPAAAPRPPGGGTELAAGLADAVAELVVELRRERARADTRGVGLHHAPDRVDVLGANPCADARGTRHGVRRRDERIGAVVDVEERALGALEDHQAIAVERLPDDLRGVRDVLLEPVAERAVLLGHGMQVERGVLGVRPQGEALGLERGVDLLPQDLLVEQVLHADPEPRRLVRVAGPDAAARGADLQLAQLHLALVVEQPVVGHDHVGVG